MFEIFGPIFEQNVDYGPIFEKNANFGPIFVKSVNFEHFVNGRRSHYKYTTHEMTLNNTKP